MPDEAKPFKHERVLATDEQLRLWQISMRNEQDMPVQVRGPCPWCGHETTADLALDVLAITQSGESTELPPHERVTRVADCRCGVPHPPPQPTGSPTPTRAAETAPAAGQPPVSIDSCGRWWLISVALAPGAEQPVRGGDESLLAAAKAVQGAVANEEARVRASAEKWIAGVAALLALFGLSGAAAAKDAFEGVPSEGALIGGVLAAGALVFSAVAVFHSYRAAYSWPVPVDVGDDVRLREWYAKRRERVASAASDLVSGVTSACIALAFLAFAVGVIWFWPRDDPKPLVQVSLVDDSFVCGRLLDTEDDSPQTMRVRETDGDVNVLEVADVSSVAATSKCP